MTKQVLNYYRVLRHTDVFNRRTAIQTGGLYKREK